MKILVGRAIKGPGLGDEKAVMGHAWWYWNPTVAWMDWNIAGGRMRGLQFRWLCFFCDMCHLTRDAEG